MTNPLYPALPVSIIRAALAHAEAKYRRTLSETRLTELYWQIRWRRDQLRALRKKNPSIHVSSGFYAVREWVLDRYFPQLGPEGQLERRAFSSALGKIGQEFKKRSQPGFQITRSERDRIMDYVTLDKDRRQYRFIT